MGFVDGKAVAGPINFDGLALHVHLVNGTGPRTVEDGLVGARGDGMKTHPEHDVGGHVSIAGYKFGVLEKGKIHITKLITAHNKKGKSYKVATITKTKPVQPTQPALPSMQNRRPVERNGIPPALLSQRQCLCPLRPTCIHLKCKTRHSNISQSTIQIATYLCPPGPKTPTRATVVTR